MLLLDGKLSWAVWGSSILAVAFGFLAAAVDVVAPFGDDTSKVTLFLWLVSSGLLGFLQPRRPWRWALLIGPWVPAAHFVFHVLHLAVPFTPSVTTILILVPVSLVACLVAAYGGSLIRRAVGQA